MPRKTYRRRGHWAAHVKSSMAVGLRHGFRSGLEEKNARHLEAHGVAVLFETHKIKYTVPETQHTYTVDFELPSGILVETKGRFEPQDRKKHLYVKAQHPEKDLRFVFQRATAPIRKGSKTTYAMWADKHGFTWATGLIPVAWLTETTSSKRRQV